MASSPWPRSAGGAPAPPPEAASAAAATAAATPTSTSEQHLVKEGGNATAAAVPQQQEEAAANPHLPRDNDSEAVIQEHEQKINRYQAILAARLKAKYFSKKAFDGVHPDQTGFIKGRSISESFIYAAKLVQTCVKRIIPTSASSCASQTGNIFEAETTVEGETIQSSRWPCTRSFTNPEFFPRDKISHEKGNSPSSAADSSAKNSSPPLVGDVSPKNNASALATENNLMPGKRQQSKKT